MSEKKSSQPRQFVFVNQMSQEERAKDTMTFQQFVIAFPDSVKVLDYAPRAAWGQGVYVESEDGGFSCIGSDWDSSG